jgi:hypothetical protein
VSGKSKGFWRNPDVMGPRKQAVARALDNQSRTALRQRDIMLRGRSGGFALAQDEPAGGESAAKPDRPSRD